MFLFRYLLLIILFKDKKKLRQEKHDYLEEKKQQKLEGLLKIARKEDKKSKVEQK